MKDNKIQITKKLVIDIYIRSYFFRYFALNLFSVIYITALILWYDDLINIIINFMPFELDNFITVFLIFPICGLLFLYDLISTALEITRVLKGNFYISTDKVITRQETPKRSRVKKFNHLKLKFEKYGNFSIRRTYSPLKKKFVSAKAQLNEAYIGDVYHVAVMNKKRNIISIFNPNDYYVE